VVPSRLGEAAWGDPSPPPGLAPSRPGPVAGRLETPPPGPLPEAERGRSKTVLLPLSATGRGPGGGVLRRPLREKGRNEPRITRITRIKKTRKRQETRGSR